MGFNRRKIEADRRAKASAQEAFRRTADPHVREDAERLITAWNARQARQMPALFAPTIGAARAAHHWFLCVRCLACRSTSAIDLRAIEGARP